MVAATTPDAISESAGNERFPWPPKTLVVASSADPGRFARNTNVQAHFPSVIDSPPQKTELDCVTSRPLSEASVVYAGAPWYW